MRSVPARRLARSLEQPSETLLDLAGRFVELRLHFVHEADGPAGAGDIGIVVVHTRLVQRHVERAVVGAEKVIPNSPTPEPDDRQIGGGTPVVHEVKRVHMPRDLSDAALFHERFPVALERQVEERVPELIEAIGQRDGDEGRKNDRLARENRLDGKAEQQHENEVEDGNGEERELHRLFLVLFFDGVFAGDRHHGLGFAFQDGCLHIGEPVVLGVALVHEPEERQDTGVEQVPVVDVFEEADGEPEEQHPTQNEPTLRGLGAELLWGDQGE